MFENLKKKLKENWKLVVGTALVSGGVVYLYLVHENKTRMLLEVTPEQIELFRKYGAGEVVYDTPELGKMVVRLDPNNVLVVMNRINEQMREMLENREVG